jgi:hypothetical protein
MTSVVIIEKSGIVKEILLKNITEQELCKKAGFKTMDGFKCQTTWTIGLGNKRYSIYLYGKTDGRANQENTYEFPPPVDTVLFFGSCALVCSVKNSDETWSITSLSLEQWNKMYEKLFGGFEDLAATAVEDENEVDELANVPKEKKTKHGYLKDGFVVDSSDTEEDEEEEEGSEEELEDEEQDSDEIQEDELELEDIGSELSEEEYDYDTDDKE